MLQQMDEKLIKKMCDFFKFMGCIQIGRCVMTPALLVELLRLPAACIYPNTMFEIYNCQSLRSILGRSGYNDIVINIRTSHTYIHSRKCADLLWNWHVSRLHENMISDIIIENLSSGYFLWVIYSISVI